MNKMPEEELKMSHRSRKRVKEVKRKARPGIVFPQYVQRNSIKISMQTIFI